MANIQYSSIISNNQLQQHLDANQNDIIKPTIFDILAQENLHELFASSFNHLFKWLCNYSEALQRFQSYSDEIYLIIHSLVDHMYLKIQNSLFSEHFYGLKRDKNLLVNKKLRLLSILFSIVVPYIKRKLDNLYETLEREIDEQESSTTQSSKIKKSTFKAIKLKIFKLTNTIFIKYYPYFHLFWSLLFWYYRFMYIFNFSNFNSPLLHILGIRLTYNTDNINSIQQSSKLSVYLNRLFTSLLFFIQFYNWYENLSEDDNMIMNEQFMNKADLNINYLNQLDKSTFASKSSDIKIIEPPKLSKIILTKSGLNANTSDFYVLCPLCNSIRTNDCALNTSGFVFCYPCIFKYVSKNKSCPITKIPSNLNNLVRIYNSE